MCKHRAHGGAKTCVNEDIDRGVLIDAVSSQKADVNARNSCSDANAARSAGAEACWEDRCASPEDVVNDEFSSSAGDSVFSAFTPEDMYGAPVEEEQAVGEKSFSQKLKGLPKLVLVKCIRFYQKGISPLFPPTCRYVPSCSQYAIIAIQRYGFVKGGWMATKRVLRCHPWHAGGYDPVP